MPGRFPTRPVLGVTAILVLVLGAAFWIAGRPTQGDGEALLAREMESRSLLLASALAPALVHDDRAVLADVLGLAGREPRLVFVSVEDSAGRVLASHGDPAATGGRTAAGLIAQSREIQAAGQRLGSLHLVYSIGSPEGQTAGTFRQGGLIAAAGLAAALLAFALLASALAGWARREGRLPAADLLTRGGEHGPRASEARYREVLDNIKEVVFRTDREGRWTFLNPAWAELTGHPVEQTLGRELLESVHPDDRELGRLLCDALAAGEQDTCRHELRFLCRGGGFRWVEVYARLGRTAGGGPAGIFGTLMDITDRKSAETRVERLAFYDALTGLPNRVLLARALAQAQAMSSRNGAHGALLFIDLDNFKDINDTLGHQAGDRLLVEAGRRILGCVRESDTVARLGGDEFVILLEGLSIDPMSAADEARVVADKLISTLGLPFRLMDTERHCTPSIGVTLFLGRDRGGEELLKQVDLAMYRAKAEGRNRVCFFDRAIEESAAARVQLESDLRLAIRDSGRLHLYFQPQVDVGGRLTGVEALLRWQHPQRGWLLPGEFIPVAERSGLIHPIGEWVLEQACAQLAAWSRTPGMSHLTVSVNLCALQLLDDGLEPMLLGALGRHGVDPCRLRLELTESVFLGHSEEILHTMRTLGAHGLTFALDDFGTGYSSLSYLKRLPLTEMKIDRSFVAGLPEDPHDAAIVETILTLARSLGLGIIAEGVETDSQLKFLRDLGCDRYQGFLFGRPEPARALQLRWARPGREPAERPPDMEAG
jgi:diguanylate cyclase (GGDEF)-like protein/PAS domain S-box-containing protein